MTASFDVFDTCLARRTAVPSDRFRGLVPRIARLLNQEPTDDFAADVAWARVRAEELVRANSVAHDVDLKAIWQMVCRLLGLTFQEDFVEAELELERRCLYPVGATLELVEKARQSGRRVVFISDTCLPHPFLAEVLEEHGFYRPGDALYLREDAKRAARSGALFRHVLAEEEKGAKGLHHPADPPGSDTARPWTPGAGATVQRHCQLTRTEHSLAMDECSSEGQGAWAGAMRMSRIHTDANTMGGNLKVVSQFVGPFLLSFAGWVLDQARREGVQRLYFASRDCQIACRVAQLLAHEMGGIECRYLYVSRQSLLLPTVRNASREGLNWLRRPYERNDLAGILAKLEISYEETRALWEGLGAEGQAGADFCLTEDEHWDTFWARLESPELARQVESQARKRRKGALAYLRAQGLMDELPTSFVDLGWSLSSQRALNELLTVHGGRTRPVGGYYLQYLHQRPSLRGTGPVRALFTPVPQDRRQAFKPVLPHDYANILEHTIGLADHESVHHYEPVVDRLRGAGEPVPFGASGPLAHASGGLPREVREGAVAFASVHRDLALSSWSLDSCATRRRLALLVREVLGSPSRQIVMELKSIRCSQDQNHRFHRPLARPLRIRDELPGGWGSSRDPIPAWEEGSLALTRPMMRVALHLIRLSRDAIPASWKARLRRAIGRQAAART